MTMVSDGPPSSVPEDAGSVQDDVVRMHRALAAGGLSDGVWGHAALRDAAGRGVWIKAAGWGLDEVDTNRVVLIDPDGAVVSGDGPTGKPSSPSHPWMFRCARCLTTPSHSSTQTQTPTPFRTSCGSLRQAT